MNQRHEGVGGGPDHEEDCLGPDDDILADDFDDLDEFDSNSDMEDSIGESNSLESFQVRSKQAGNHIQTGSRD